MHKHYPEPIRADDNLFEFAIGFLQIMPYKYVAHDPRIGQLNVRMVEMDQRGENIVFIKTPQETKTCNSTENFTRDHQDSAFSRNITKFICPDTSKVEFLGTMISPVHKYLHLELLACENKVLRATPGYENDTCATSGEVTDFFNRHMLVGYVANNFVDKTEFSESPIRTLNDLLFYEQLNFVEHVRKEIQLNYNEVELKDSYFQIWSQQQTEFYNFLSVDHSVSQSLRTINPTAYFQAQFRLNNRVNEYERVVYSFFDMAGDIGGFMEAVYIFFVFGIGAYANRMFFASVIQDVFKVRLEAHGQTIFELQKA